MFIKKNVIKFIVIIMLFVGISANANTNNPYTLTKETANSIFNTIKTQKLTLPKDRAKLESIVIKDLKPYVHIKYAGALILGSHYKTSTPQQKDKYFKAFEKLLVHTAVEFMGMYKDEQVIVESEKNIENKDILNINVKLTSSSKKDINLDFKWRKNSKSGQWQVFDIASEGISIIDTKRNEWAKILQDQGIDYLTNEIEKLSTKPFEI